MSIRIVLSTVALALTLTACGEAVTASPITQEVSPVATSAPTPSLTVTVDPFSSAKVRTTVAVGTTVKFVSPSDEAKVQLAGDISSPMFGKEGWVTTFGKAGTFQYHSALNALVGGTIVVQ